MDVQTKTADFRRAVTIANKVVERRGTTIPALGAIHCHANGALEVSATDLDLTVTTKIEREPGVDADFLLRNPRAMLQAVAAAGGKTIGISHKDAQAIVVSDSLRLKVGTFPADDLPLDLNRPLDTTFAVTLSQQHVADLARVAGAMSTEETRYYLNGVHLAAIAPGLIRATATDGHRLYFMEIAVPDATGELPGAGLIVPTKTIRLLLDLSKSSPDGVRVTVGNRAPANSETTTAPEKSGMPVLRLGFRERAAEVTLTSKLIDGTFPDCQRVVPTGGDIQALFQVADMRRAIRAIAGHSKSERAVRIELLENGAASLSAAYVSIDLAADIVIPCQHSRPGYVIGFNGGYLASVLDASRGDEIVLTMSNPDAPAIVRNPADTAWTAVLMPIRVSTLTRA